MNSRLFWVLHCLEVAVLCGLLESWSNCLPFSQWPLPVKKSHLFNRCPATLMLLLPCAWLISLDYKCLGNYWDPMLPEQAAATLAALSVAEPSSACRLLTQQLEGLEEASSQLASLVRYLSTSLSIPVSQIESPAERRKLARCETFELSQESDKRVASSIKLGLQACTTACKPSKHMVYQCLPAIAAGTMCTQLSCILMSLPVRGKKGQ